MGFRLSRTILVVDEPPMGSDVYPENPEDQGLALGIRVSGGLGMGFRV